MTRNHIRARMLTRLALLVLVAMPMIGGLFAADARAGTPVTKVFLNGKPVQVFFNDGDSFRVIKGTLQGAKARIAGYNTLETHGAVHVWGGWNIKELYHLAKMATLHARRGVWECTSDGKTDTYGRMLVFCPTLGEELVRMGLAHVMTVDDSPGNSDLIAAQREAISRRRGIWSHGVPAFILTSLHSAEEDVDGRGTYNRLVSTADGHSVKWGHTSRYQECEKVCQITYSVDDAVVTGVVDLIRSEAAATSLIAGLDDATLMVVIAEYAAYRHISRRIVKDRRRALKVVLDGYAGQGRFGADSGTSGSCMVHVPFTRRFGGTKAACLKK